MQTSLAILASLSLVAAQPFLKANQVLPVGNLLTTDNGGPYNLTLLPVQVSEVQAGIAAAQGITDADVINFLGNVECLEGQFDTWGTFGVGFIGNLGLGGPAPGGARKANLTNATLPYLEEVALNEQGHALAVRHSGGSLPCPVIDLPEGFNAIMATAFAITPAAGQTAQAAIAAQFGSAFDPFLNDQNFVLSVLTLEELGATGNKGLSGVMINPVLQNVLAGLATSATAQATVERFLLWQLRDTIIQPFNETAAQVFARVSAARDFLDGPQSDDQGIYNTDPRTIAVPGIIPGIAGVNTGNAINLIPTDVHGLTFSRTPQQVIRIVTAGSPNGRGGFFPQGLLGNINSPSGYNVTTAGTAPFPQPGNGVSTGYQAAASQVGNINQGPVVGTSPTNVTGELVLTQGLGGQLEDTTYMTRGYTIPPPLTANFANLTTVQVATQAGAPAPAPSMAAMPFTGGSVATATAGRKQMLRL